VVGSTPLAKLLAGLLAGQHRCRVVQIGDTQAGLRLPRGFDLSSGPITRPETWALLEETTPETLKLINRIAGREGWTRANPLFLSEEAEGVEALAYIRHVAEDYGHEVEPVALPSLRGGQQGWMLRDIALLHRSVLEPALAPWLVQQGIAQLPGSQTRLSLDEHGGATIEMGGQQLVVAHLVLADDEAVLGNMPATELAGFAVLRPRATLLLRPLPALPTSVVVQLDQDMVVVQHAGGSVSAVGQGRVDELAPALRHVTGPQSGWVQAGQARYHAVGSHDGAPFVGRFKDSGPTILAGLGAVGAFLAPSLARWLAGAARPGEQGWIEARSPMRSTAQSWVAEWSGATLEDAP
jgi:hypothetical protein